MSADDEQPDTPARGPNADGGAQDASEPGQTANGQAPELAAEPAGEAEQPASEQAAEAEQPAAETEQPVLADAEQPTGDQQTEQPAAETEQPAAETEQPAAEAEHAAAETEQPAAAAAEGPAQADVPDGGSAEDEEEEGAEEPAPRVKPAVPGAHLEVDIVPEGADPLGRGEEYVDPYAIEDEESQPGVEGEEDEREEALTEPIATAAIDLAAGARYRATGKRKTAIARVTLRPGSGTYLINGRALEVHFPRTTLQRNIRQPLETVGYQERMDVVARLHGGGISAQAGALRHGVSRALLEADPNLRGELKRRGFLTRDSRAKERKKAGLKKARKRPQFSKR
jgi:small subunit ribosomal protein S9